MWKINKIVVPTDFSAESLKALRYATEFVQSFLGAEILLVHVVEPAAYPVPSLGDLEAPTFRQEVQDACTQRLDDLVAEEVPEGASVRAILLEGRPWAEITQLAEREKADLILVATHGYTGLKHFAMGSTAERVVRAAPCPVLTVREIERDFVA